MHIPSDSSPSRGSVSVSAAVPAPTFDQAPERRLLRVNEVAVDAGVQVRDEIDEAVVDDYAERLGEGVRFPPVVVFRDGSRYCLADGFHRLEACRRAGHDQIEADVYVGTLLTRCGSLWGPTVRTASGCTATINDMRSSSRSPPGPN